MLKTRYLLGMTTCDRVQRGGVDLLPSTLASLEKSGLWNSGIDFHLLLHDTGSTHLDYLNRYRSLAKASIACCEKESHQCENVIRLLEHALDRYDAEYLVFLEDDILFCRKWIENLDAWLGRYATEEDYMISLYACYAHVLAAFFRGRMISHIELHGFYGAQALVFPFAKVPDLLAKLTVLQEEKFPGYIDMQFKEALMRSGMTDIPTCVPSIVQHINRGSTLSTPTHRSPVFFGEDQDPSFYRRL
jgi:hypothetical protein